MTSEKIAISLPKGIAKLDELSILLAEMLQESGGPLTKAEARAADRALGIVPRKARRKRS